MAEHKVARSTAYSPGWDARPSQSNHFPITSALETLYSGQSKLSTWLMKPIYLVVTPPPPTNDTVSEFLYKLTLFLLRFVFYLPWWCSDIIAKLLCSFWSKTKIHRVWRTTLSNRSRQSQKLLQSCRTHGSSQMVGWEGWTVKKKLLIKSIKWFR